MASSASLAAPQNWPPTKKRKQNHHGPQRPPSTAPQKAFIQHWDDPGSVADGMIYDDYEDSVNPASIATGSVAEEVEGNGEEGAGNDDAAAEQEEEMSRPLTHAEIWDDSALIDAWNSAEAEYEAYHGTSKAWKTEPMKKSPLWYNKPYTVPPSKPELGKPTPPQPQPDGESEPEPDTVPLDFDTFVPTHDPSLGIPSDPSATTAPAATGPTAMPFLGPLPSMATVSRDEAFHNALSAMYWSGYWTAVYYYQSQTSGKNDNNGLVGTTEDRAEASEDENEQELVPTQR